ncbi:MAG: acyl-CoA dehydrogenase [Sphingobium sp.]|nr:acyl-CoA dehydrogenase [Sphingobium sp.]
MSFDKAAEAITIHVTNLPGWERLRTLAAEADLDEATISEIIGTAAKFSADILEPFDKSADHVGCRVENGRVITAPGHKEAWQAFVEGGWPTLNASPEFGGSGLPFVIHSACEELFNRGSLSFGMLATPCRCASMLLDEHASDDIKNEWLPKFISGEWGATICISEGDAGSDVGRIRTMATPQEDGSWSISGEKMWISYGDHDLTSRIGHMVLARTPDAPPGTRGISLFLVPSDIDGAHNGTIVHRIEEKMGLHGSPTCNFGFEESKGYLIGQLHRGLPQLFTMIIGMRISVGSQGAALANAAADLGIAYAADRKQGGKPDAAPIAIARHKDVQRQLSNMAARAEVTRGLVLTTSILADLSKLEDDDAAKAQHSALMGWLLPITKNFCAESAFITSSEAIQVLGGAGYTTEWPAERYARDARVLAIYEGTTGMQAQDLLHRRLLKDEGKGLKAFLTVAQADIDAATDKEAAANLTQVIAELTQASEWLGGRTDTPADIDYAAVSYLNLASLAATGWVALRLSNLSGDALRDKMAARGRYWLRFIPGMAANEHRLIKAGAAILEADAITFEEA